MAGHPHIDMGSQYKVTSTNPKLLPDVANPNHLLTIYLNFPLFWKQSVGLDHVEHFIFCAIGELTSIVKK